MYTAGLREDFMTLSTVVVPTRFAEIHARGTLAQHTFSRTHSVGSAKRTLSCSVRSSGRHG